MKKSIGALLLLALTQPTLALADGGAYGVSGAVVVRGGGGYYRPGGGYYGHGGGYYGRGWGYRGPGVGVYLGAPWVWGATWGPAYYPPPLVYPPVISVPPPVVYVERPEGNLTGGSGESLEPGFWYYCRDRAAYYPAVSQCPSAWEKVPPANR